MWNRQRVRQLLLRGYRDLRIRTAAVVMFALAWWGVLYPELCFTESTYEQIMVVDGQEIVLQETDIEDILNASGDEIVVKSRLVEWLEPKSVTTFSSHDNSTSRLKRPYIIQTKGLNQCTLTTIRIMIFQRLSNRII